MLGPRSVFLTLQRIGLEGHKVGFDGSDSLRPVGGEGGQILTSEKLLW